MRLRLSKRLWDVARIKRCQLSECRAACCLYGVWMDSGEQAEILDHLEIILPHMPEGEQNPSTWWDGRVEDDPFVPSGKVIHTTLLLALEHYGETACVFLRGDHKCALQVAGEIAGFHPWRFKPFYCVLHPLDLDEDGKITLDNDRALLDEPASCLRAGEQEVLIMEIFNAELRYLLGESAFINATVRGIDLD